jgi:16S rRNA (adenine1518-N6/adenine1519-N6)-dimethyltransferase
MAKLDTPSSLLRRHGLRAKQSWGQNFLGDPDVLADIASAANLQPGEPVVELGAGLGHLTQAILDTGAQVTAVERDRDMVKILRETFANEPRLKIVEANATELEFAKAAEAPKVAVLGNLPYHLTSSILFALLEQRTTVSRAVFTLQKEVVVRLAAKPGNRDYGILTVLLNLYFEIEEVMNLPAGLFHPPPNVDSAVLSLWSLAKPRAEVTDDARFIRLVKAAFAQRRKTLSNSLKSDATLGDVAGALGRAQIDGQRRAETLSTEEFAAIERALTG